MLGGVGGIKRSVEREGVSRRSKRIIARFLMAMHLLTSARSLEPCSRVLYNYVKYGNGTVSV